MWLKRRAVDHVEFLIELITWYADKLIKLITIIPALIVDMQKHETLQ